MIRISTLLLLLLLTCLLYCCSGGTSVAGGAGAGNPVVISIVAASKKASDTTGTIRVHDKGKIPIDIYSVRLRVDQIDLLGDSCDVSLPGPFVCNLITGEVEPSIVFDEIPDGVYRSVNLHVIDAKDCCKPIQIAGNAVINNELKGIYLAMYGSPNGLDSSIVHNFGVRDSSIVINNGVPSSLVLLLDDQKWFDSVNVKGVLNNEEFEIDSMGRVLIEECDKRYGPANNFIQSVKAELFEHGEVAPLGEGSHADDEEEEKH